MKTQEEDLISLVALYVIMIYTSISLKQNRLLLSWLIIIQQHIPLYSTTGRNAICFFATQYVIMSDSYGNCRDKSPFSKFILVIGLYCELTK